MIRNDGMLQAGPNPASEIAASRGNVTLLTRMPKKPFVGTHELETQKSRK
jgi:hypothetical protein